MRVILHIGQHKTGSKALQSAIYANRSHLAASGSAYPVEAGSNRPLRPYEMNHHHLFAAVRAAVDAGEGGAELAALRALLDRLLAACSPTSEAMILSAEDLFDMHTAHEAAFMPARVGAGSRLLAAELAARGCTTRLVCYLRRQDHLLAAHYAQYIKGSPTHHPEFGEFRAMFAPRLDADGLLSLWEEAFGKEAVTVAAYEPREMPGGIVADFFGRVLGLEPPPVTVPFPDDLEAFNITPSRDHLDYLRLLNRRGSRGRPVLPREQVLESAFRDRNDHSAGIAAWLSPGERGVLLAEHEPGNRRIAARHGMGATLFRERMPTAGDPWTPPPAVGLERLIELDTRARRFAAERPAAVSRSRCRGRHAGLIIWVVSPEARPKDRAAAVELFAAVAGHPDLESRVVDRLGPTQLPAWWRRTAFVVLVGPPSGGWPEAITRWSFERGGGRVVMVAEPPPEAFLAG